MPNSKFNFSFLSSILFFVVGVNLSSAETFLALDLEKLFFANASEREQVQELEPNFIAARKLHYESDFIFASLEVPPEISSVPIHINKRGRFWVLESQLQGVGLGRLGLSQDQLSFLDEIYLLDAQDLDLSINPEQYQFGFGEMDLKIDLGRIEASELTGVCLEAIDPKTTDPDSLGPDRCFGRANFALRSFKFDDGNEISLTTLRDGQVPSDQTDIRFTVDASKFEFVTPYIQILTGETDIQLNSMALTCARERDREGQLLPPTHPDFREGCVETTKLKLDRARISNPGSGFDINVNSVEVDSDRFKANAPRVEYLNANNDKVILDSFKGNCGLDINLKIVEILDWKTILANCVKDAEISATKVWSQEGRSSPEETARSLKISTFPDSSEKGKTRFQFSINVRLPLGIRVTKEFDGQVRYLRDVNQIRFRLDRGDVLDRWILALFAPSFIEQRGRTLIVQL